MIYVNAVKVSKSKSNILNQKPMLPNLPIDKADSVSFGNKLPRELKPISKFMKILNKFWCNDLVEKIVIDKFGKKSIEKYKNKELVHKILFKKTENGEFPQILLKYENQKLIEAKGFSEEGKAEFKRKYDKVTGKQIAEIYYASDGKTPSIFGL